MSSDAVDTFNELAGDLEYPMFIVTARAGDEPLGCLVGFATQMSIDPPRFLIMCGMVYLQASMTPFTFTSIIRSQVSTVSSGAVVSCCIISRDVTAALLNRMSILPKRCATCSMQERIDSWLPTSRDKPIALLPIRLATSLARSSVLAVTTTVAPSAA